MEPVRKSIVVNRSPASAFELFTAGMHTWWPLLSHSVWEKDAATCLMECRAGGRIIERHENGEESLWGTVTTWEPPARLVFTWHPGRGPDTAQQVEVRFTGEAGNKTRVDLVHSGWETLGKRAKAVRDEYVTGWDKVFVERYGGSAGR
jgi:uncharacterized protein YndB with AHSA1/START domain